MNTGSVLLQMRVSTEFLPTNTTGYFALIVVRLFVSFTSASICKFLATHFTFIIFFSSMNELMPSKRGGVRKFLPTPVIGAGKWLLPSVSPHVRVEVIICVELFPTYFAEFRFNSLVDE